MKYNIILGSQSPRRKEILEKAGLSFKQVSIDVEEDYLDVLAGKDVPEFLAIKKSKAFGVVDEGDLLLTSDTIVLLDNEILGKPMDADDAFSMLKKLVGREHLVVTGVCLRSDSKEYVFSDTTVVGVSDISDEEIRQYVETHQPFDKAGSYGVQEWFGIVAVAYIRGSYFNVMGLPMHSVSAALKQF